MKNPVACAVTTWDADSIDCTEELWEWYEFQETSWERMKTKKLTTDTNAWEEKKEQRREGASEATYEIQQNSHLQKKREHLPLYLLSFEKIPLMLFQILVNSGKLKNH